LWPGDVVRRLTVDAPKSPGSFVTTRTFGETLMFLVCLRAPASGRLRQLVIVVAGWAPFAPATAQLVTPGTPATSAPAAELTPAERAKRDAEKVFHWITIHGDKPRKPVAATPTKDEKPPTVVRLKPQTPAATSTAAPAAPALAANLGAAPKPEAGASTVAVNTAAPLPTPAPAADVVAKNTTVSAPPSGPGPAAISSVPPAAVDDDAIDTLVPVTQSEPKFPINLVRTLRNGQVQVRFTVQPDGSVVEPVVVSSSNARLNPAALAAVLQWRFAPVHKPQQGVVDLGFTAPD
jgi:TonB family protein